MDNIPTENYAIWFKETKELLLTSEPSNILVRCRYFEDIINKSVCDLNQTLHLPEIDPSERYECKINPRNHLSFLYKFSNWLRLTKHLCVYDMIHLSNSWVGLSLFCDSKRKPRNKHEYEKKAKNWLNGRRAPNYSNTLFPKFVSEAETYASKISKIVIKNDNQNQQNLYYNTLIYQILSALAGCECNLNDKAKKAPFFCKNSIERKGKLKQILQRYAFDHQYQKGFPSCFAEAIDYYAAKSSEYLTKYKKLFLKNEQAETAKGENTDDVIMQPVDSKHKVIKSEQQQQQQMEQINVCVRSERNPSLYWKKMAMELQNDLEREKERKMHVQRERDELRLVINQMHNKLINLHQRYALTQNMNNVIAAPSYQMNTGNMPNNGLPRMQLQNHNVHMHVLPTTNIQMQRQMPLNLNLPRPQQPQQPQQQQQQSMRVQGLVEHLRKCSDQSPEKMIAALNQYLSTN